MDGSMVKSVRAALREDPSSIPSTISGSSLLPATPGLLDPVPLASGH